MVCNGFARTILASLCPWNTLEEIALFRKNVAAVARRFHTVSDLKGPRFEQHTSRSTNKRVTVRPTGRS